MILKYLEKDPLKNEPEQLVSKVLTLLELITFKYTAVHGLVIDFVRQQLLELHSLSTESVMSLTNTFKMIFKQHKQQTRQLLVKELISSVGSVESAQILTIILNELSIFLEE